MLDAVGFRESRAPGYAARFEYDAVNRGRGIVRFSIQGARRDSDVGAESTRGLPDVSVALPAAAVHQRMSLQDLAARRLHGVSLFRPDSAAGAKACGNPPEKQRKSKVEYSRNLTRGHSREDIPIYRQPDPGDLEAS
ncbi:MAG: hypothetical protein WBL23_01415 [Salinisphaera sp.]